MKKHSWCWILICLFALIFTLKNFPVAAQEPPISVHYLGHSSFVIYFDNGVYIVTDYGISNSYGYVSPIYGIGSLKPDILTYSHKHQDHYDPVRMPDSVRYILTDFDTLSLAGLTIRPVRVAENAVLLNDNSAFIFSYKDFTLVHSGDTQANIMNIASQMNKDYLKKNFPEKIDLLLMPIEGVSQFIPQAEAFIDFLRPKRVIPMHYWSKKCESDFLAYLESQNQSAGKNYRIDRRSGAKYAVAVSDTATIPIQIISLNPSPFSDFMVPCIRFNQLKLDDRSGNNNGRADAAESVSLVVTLQNFWIAAAQVTATLRTGDPDVQPGNMTSHFGNIAMDQNRTNDDNPFSFSMSPTALAHYSTFYLDITAENDYSVIDSFTIVIGTPTRLLIDDDNGKSYESSYLNVMIPELWEVASKGCPPMDLLRGYESVIWFTGDDRESSLTAEEQSLIAAFLDQGGKLWLCGQNIAYDLAGSGSFADSAFFSNYLHAKFVADSCNATVAVGVTGDPISGGMMMSLAKSAVGEGNKTAPDVIKVMSPAEIILKYIPGNGAAALRYENPGTGSRLVYLTFGIEKIIGPKQTTSADFVQKIFTWLAGATSVEDRSQPSAVPNGFSLCQNYPNPFNPITTIDYSIPQSARVTLKVYNLLGEELVTLVDKRQSVGIHQVIFDGKTFLSGIYFYQLQAGNWKASRKCVLVR